MAKFMRGRTAFVIGVIVWLVAPAALLAKDPLLVPVKIDGPAHDPASHSHWYDIQGSTFERHILAFNHLPWYPGQENRNHRRTSRRPSG